MDLHFDPSSTAIHPAAVLSMAAGEWSAPPSPWLPRQAWI